MSSIRPPQVAQRLVDAYITGLRQRLPTLCIRRLDQLPGATEQQLLRLRQVYPAAPAELLYMLQRVNGTYWESIRAPSDASSSSSTMSAGTASGGGASSSASSASSTPLPPPGAPTAKTKPSAKAAAASFVKSAFQGPGRKPINKEKIAVPILGSALGSCPYFLTAVEDIIAPFQQPFPPKRKSAPRQPLCEDFSSTSSSGPATTMASASPSSPSTGATAPPDSTQQGATAPPAVATGRLPGKASIAAIYANANIVRGFPPSLAEGGKGQPTAQQQQQELTMAEGSAGEAATAPFDPRRKTVYVDPRIDIGADFGQWLAFADSMLPHHQPWEDVDEDEDHEVAGGGGGSQQDTHKAGAALAGKSSTQAASQPPRKASVSRLYVDFCPDEMHGGVSGQIVQYSRGEPESFRVIANNFGDYLKFLMSEEYEFTEELEDDDDEDAAREKATGSGASGKATAATIVSPSGQPITPPPPSQQS